MKAAACAALAALTMACAAVPANAPSTLTLSGAGPYYTLDVDIAARQVSGRADLADLRVQNAAGEAMAFAWAESPSPMPPPETVAARLYRLPSLDTGAASTAEAPPRPAWIVDTNPARHELLTLALRLAPGTAGAYTLRTEASDDLQTWRTLRDDAQLVQLRSVADRELLKSEPITLGEVSARYLRLSTAPSSAVPPLVAATVTRAAHRPPAPALEWSDPIPPTRCEANACDYALPRNLPVDALQITPADIATIGQVLVSGRVDAERAPPRRHSLLHGSLHALRLKAQRADPGWDVAAIANVYRLSPAGAPELHSPPVPLSGQTWPALRLETVGPLTQLGHVAPTIRIGVRPRWLVFVARGAEPFTLTRADGMTGAMSLQQLMPGRSADDALPAASATLAPTPPVSATASVPAAVPTTRRFDAPWLWAALLAALALMGGMAWSLLRPVRPPA